MYRELAFKQEPVAHLVTHSWQKGDLARSRYSLAPYPDDLSGGTQNTQLAEWNKLAGLFYSDTCPLLLECVTALINMAGRSRHPAPAFSHGSSHFLHIVAILFQNTGWKSRILE